MSSVKLKLEFCQTIHYNWVTGNFACHHVSYTREAETRLQDVSQFMSACNQRHKGCPKSPTSTLNVFVFKNRLCKKLWHIVLACDKVIFGIF